MQHPNQRHGGSQGSLLSDLRSVPEENDAHGDLQNDRGEPGSEEHGVKDREVDRESVGIDLIEINDSGYMLFGSKKNKAFDRSTIMIIPGFNDHTIIDMGNLGMLVGRAKEMYEKLKKMEGPNGK